MKVIDVYNKINDVASFDLQESWDNSGLLIGNEKKNVENILICLDITSKVLNVAIKNNIDLIVTHHPVIFNPLNNVLSDDLVYKLITNDIAVISAHTNLDIAQNGINDILAKKFNLKNCKPLSLICDSKHLGVYGNIEDILLSDFCNVVKESLKVSSLKVSNFENKLIKNIAICGGSGSSLINDVLKIGVDVFVTSDLKHNNFVDNENLVLIDAGHFHTEIVGVHYLCGVLKDNFKNVNVIVCDEEPYIFV